ncbi:hypothetical protein QFZ23_001334 [Arthrobacter globiformis]|nr:hypothetical protein [Arthrobacter globiformis]
MSRPYGSWYRGGFLVSAAPHTLAHTPAEHTEITNQHYHPSEGNTMELFIIIVLAGLWVAGATVRAILHDGRGHTPSERSTEAWHAGRLPSVPFSEARL